PYVPGFIGRPIQEAKAFVEARRRSTEGRSVVHTLDGIERLVAFAAVPDSAVTVRVGISAQQADRAAWIVLAKGIAAMALAAVIATAFGWLAFRNLITGPVRALTRAAARLGAGDVRARTGISHDMPIVGGLAEKFDE